MKKRSRARALQSPSAAIDALEATRTFFVVVVGETAGRPPFSSFCRHGRATAKLGHVRPISNSSQTFLLPRGADFIIRHPPLFHFHPSPKAPKVSNPCRPPPTLLCIAPEGQSSIRLFFASLFFFSLSFLSSAYLFTPTRPAMREKTRSRKVQKHNKKTAEDRRML